MKPDDDNSIKNHMDHLLIQSITSDYHEPSVLDELPLGPFITQETSQLWTAKYQVLIMKKQQSNLRQ